MSNEKNEKNKKKTSNASNTPDAVIYVPSNAKINLKGNCMEPPKTEYEQSRKQCDRDAVKKIVKGQYGNSKD